MSPKKPLARYNVFTKSYRLRYVVHAGENNAERTICGREIVKASKVRFDEEAEGACQKCLQKINIERRIHPGFED